MRQRAWHEATKPRFPLEPEPSTTAILKTEALDRVGPIALFFYRALETGMTRISVDADDDTRLIVRGPMTHAGSFDSYPIAEDDDSGPGFNPEVTVMIRERGVYVIVAVLTTRLE